jgi:hypothetical protein
LVPSSESRAKPSRLTKPTFLIRSCSSPKEKVNLCRKFAARSDTFASGRKQHASLKRCHAIAMNALLVTADCLGERFCRSIDTMTDNGPSRSMQAFCSDWLCNGHLRAPAIEPKSIEEEL